jgi:hypothetical protein
VSTNPLVPRPRLARRVGRGGQMLTLASLLLLLGCGRGAYIRVQVARPGEFAQPVWVGVYFLSQETGLDGIETHELIDNPDRFDAAAGVIDKEVFPVYSGEAPHPVAREKYDPRIGWVVIAAGFPKPEACAREKFKVKKDAEITFKVSVEEKCLKITKKD